MQKNSKIKIGKSITAVLLCVVLLVTSISMVLAAGEGEYDIEMVVDLPEDALTGVFRVKLVP